MALLQVSRGGTPGTQYELAEGSTTLGRNPDSDVVVDFISVSRNHARITGDAEAWFIEDLRSRNGTYVNGQAISEKVRLANGDEIEICDLVFRFYVSDVPPVITTPDSDDDGGSEGSDRIPIGAYLPDSSGKPDEGNSSSIVVRLQAGDSSRSWRFGIKPEAKLRAVVSILQSLGRSLTLKKVLQAILDGLFEIFPQAQQGFLMLQDADNGRMRLEATRVRNIKQAEVHVSMTIVRQALDTGEAILSADAADDSRWETSQSLQGLEIRSMMCVPLLGQDDERLGVLQIDTNNMVKQFSEDDLDILLAVATPVSLAITNARFAEREMENLAMERELEFAREIQQSFLPSTLPEMPGYDVAHFYESAEHIGGDYFDCFGLKDGRICVAIGDVAGKGVPAALLMSRLYSAVRSQMLSTGDPVEAMTLINQEFSGDSAGGFRFITVMFVLLDMATGDLEVVNAGHSPLLLRDAGGEVRSIGIRNGGMPVGVLPDQDFQITTDSLAPGALFAIYTDGVTEAMNAAGKLYGRQRLSEQLQTTDASASEVIAKVRRSVDQYCGGEPAADDTCIAVVRRLGP